MYHELMSVSSPIDNFMTKSKEQGTGRNDGGRITSREMRTGSGREEIERNSVSKRKDTEERPNRMQLKRVGLNGSNVNPPKLKQEEKESRFVMSSPDDGTDTHKLKNRKKSSDDITAVNKYKKNVKEEKIPEKAVEKCNGGGERTKKGNNKNGKPVTAFGSTFRRTESELPPIPKRRTSMSAGRTTKLKTSKSKESELTVNEGVKVCRKNSSQSQLKSSLKQSFVRSSLSKNKLTNMVEETYKDNGKQKVSQDAMPRTPRDTPSKTDTKNPIMKPVNEDKAKMMPPKSEERLTEVGKNLSLLEKIQQNVRAYFSPKNSEMGKFEEEKRKVFEGENPSNEENVIILKDERILRGVKEDFMKGDQNFCNVTTCERKVILEKGCSMVAKGFYPGGNKNKTFGLDDTCNRSNEYQCKKNYYNECTEKPRKGSFHRSKIFEKNAFVQLSPQSSTPLCLILEPDEQVQNISDGLASTITQVEEFYQEVNLHKNGIRVSDERRTTYLIASDDHLTSVAIFLSGEQWMSSHTSRRHNSGCWCTHSKRYRFRSNPTRKNSHWPSCNVVRKTESARRLQEDSFKPLRGRLRSRSEGRIQFESNQALPPMLFRYDLPQIELPKKNYSPAKIITPKKKLPIVEERQWFVYSVEERRIISNKRMPSQRFESAGLTRNPTRSKSEVTYLCPKTRKMGVSSSKTAGDERSKSKLKSEKILEFPTQKIEDETSVTLKDIINLSGKIVDEGSKCENHIHRCPAVDNPKDPEEQEGSCRHMSLGHYLERLMEEKKNYLNMQKTKNFRREQKLYFIADSFNFFNLLNKEFLSKKSSNPRIEDLRNVIIQKKEQKIEEYVNMYKNVVRTSLTEPEQRLMDRAKHDLERYSDMYYELMKCICLERDDETGGKSTFSERLEIPKPGKKIQYHEILKQNTRKTTKPNMIWDTRYGEKSKPRIEKSYYVTKMEDNRRNRMLIPEETIGVKSTAYPSVAREEKSEDANHEEVKSVVELKSPQKTGYGEKKTTDMTSQSKVLLSVSLRDDNLIIKKVTDTQKDYTKGELHSSGQAEPKENENASPESKCSRGLVSEMNSTNSPVTADEGGDTTSYRKILKVESDVTVYPKSSIDEDNDSENPTENSVMKFKALRKLAGEGLKYRKSIDETHEAFSHKCPIILKRGKKPETVVATVSHSGKNDYRKERAEKIINKLLDDKIRRPKIINMSQQKHRMTELPMGMKAVETHEGKVKNNPKTNHASGRKKSPSKVNRKESSKEANPKTKRRNLWWRSEKVPVSNVNSAIKQNLFPFPQKKKEGLVVISKPSLKSADSVFGGCNKSSKDKRRRKLEITSKEEGDDETETQESNSDFSTPTGSYFEWGVETKRLLNPGEFDGDQLIYQNEERDERELQKLDYSTRGKEYQDGAVRASSTGTQELNLKPESSNAFRRDWEKLVEAPKHSEDDRVVDVLNRFMGNISEAWEAAKCLRDLIKTGSSTADVPRTPTAEINPVEDVTPKANIESFRTFLQILTSVFEDNPREEVVKTELYLLLKDIVQFRPFQTPSAIFDQEGSRTKFSKDMAGISKFVKVMLARELISDEKNFSVTRKEYEPASFVVAVKKVGEKLKDIYCKEESGTEKVDATRERPKETVQQQKIYYRQELNSSQQKKNESTDVKSNLGALAMKINEIYKERKSQRVEQMPDKRAENETPLVTKTVDVESSMYFDAVDRIQPSEHDIQAEASEAIRKGDPNLCNSVGPNCKTLWKSGDTYNKIITFLRSENPKNVKCGLTLLGRMMDEEKQSLTEKGNVTSEDHPWNELLEELTGICHAIESGMTNRQRENPELLKTSEYLRRNVDKMKLLVEEPKQTDFQDHRSSSADMESLILSRETNMERQLIRRTDLNDHALKRKHFIENAMEFIRSVSSQSAGKFPESLIPTWLVGLEEEEPMKEMREPLLEKNKEFLKRLQKEIEQRQQKIKNLVVHAKEGCNPSEKLLRKVRDLKRCYVLLQKMICDPTLQPPRWFKWKNPPEKDAANEDGDKEAPGAVASLTDRGEKLMCSQSTISLDTKSAGESEEDKTMALLSFPHFGGLGSVRSPLQEDFLTGEWEPSADCGQFRPLTA